MELPKEKQKKRNLSSKIGFDEAQRSKDERRRKRTNWHLTEKSRDDKGKNEATN